jgi:hypothetical protein
MRTLEKQPRRAPSDSAPLLHQRPRVSNWLSACLLVLAGVIAVSQAPQAQAGCPGEPALFHPCALQRAKTFNPPRTPDGKPDLQGFWRGQPAATENIEEHPKTLDDDGGKSLIVDPPDGKVPYQPWGAAQAKENRKKYVEPNVPCFLSGVPRSLYVPTHIEILQSPGHVLILFERAHAYRVIPTDGRPHAGENIQLWQGDSRGHWEGNTLIVDVTNQNAKPWFDQAGNFYTDAVHMVERFTLIDPDTIHYVVTIEDENVYTKPWTMAFPLRRNKEQGFQLIEEACHEGERNTQPLIDLGFQIYPGMKSKKER